MNDSQTDKATGDGMESFSVLGSKVHIIENPGTVKVMDRWIQEEADRCHYIVNTGMHGIMEAHRDPSFKTVLRTADLFCPDGILLVLTARVRGHSINKSKIGPELMSDFLNSTKDRGYKHYFFGDTDATLEAVGSTLREKIPGIQIVGAYSPPFRLLTPEEDQAIVDEINRADPDILWVGLGSPKQEQWMYDHRDRLNATIMVGVGAAFKFISGSVKRASPLVSNSGFEWLWRFAKEPKRIWRRVLVDAPQFVFFEILEISGLKKYQ